MIDSRVADELNLAVRDSRNYRVYTGGCGMRSLIDIPGLGEVNWIWLFSETSEPRGAGQVKE